MKEVFEKIKDGINHIKEKGVDCNNCSYVCPDGGCEDRALDQAIEIVNQVAEEVLEKEFSEWCHDCKEYDKEKHHCPRWCKVIRTTVEEIKGNLDVPDINVGDIELLDSLHEKILKSKFAEEVTEAEIDALVKAKQSLNENKQSLNDGWIPCSEKTPEFEIYTLTPMWVTMRKKDGTYRFVTHLKWNGYHGRWEWNNGKTVSDTWEIIAWQKVNYPAPYEPKGENHGESNI